MAYNGKLRLGNHGLAVETGRHQNVLYSSRICERCFCAQQQLGLFECISS
jgi:hypothetical protein